MFGIRAAIPATSRLNVIKYANLASLLQTNELLGNYRNLFWFGSPIGLPLVEWTAAVVYGGVLTFAFCWVFARAQLLSASKRGFLLGLRHKTHATSVYKEEARKLLLLNGAALVLAAFAGFGIYQGVTAESYIGPDEIYYAYYMKHTSGPFTQESYDWLEEQGEEFAPMLEVQRKVAAGELSSDAMLAFSSLQQKYSVYSRVINQNINYCHNCMSGRPQRFEAHHNHIGHSFDRLLGCFPGCSCSLFGVLHNFGGFGLCSGGSCCARGCGGSHLGRRHRSRRRFLPCSYLESGQRIVPQTALVKIDGIRPPRLVRRHLSGGWCGWFSRGLSLPIPPIIIR